ncbi:MAG: hemerythrin family protein [Clostridiales bacterium]|nr:hemerythrin family protein [Clostridiales bacterium]
MTWKDSFAIGIPAIDKQHKELCDQVDKLFAACSGGKGAEEVGKTLDFLASYTVRHFSDEEAFQQEIKYPKFRQHKAMHTEFLQQVTKLKKEATENGINIAMVIKINQMISDWLVNHIKGTDSDLKNYV